MPDTHYSGREETPFDTVKLPGTHIAGLLKNPFSLFVLVLISIFVNEAILMYVLNDVLALPVFAELFVDSFLLTIVLGPILYLFFYRPFKLSITAWEKAMLSRDNEVYEWNKTTNCVAEMIAILDADKKIRKVNKSMQKFAGNGGKTIIGMPWITFLREHHLPVPPNSSESRIIFHEPTRKWFEINFYPLKFKHEDTEDTIVSLHNITEMKRVTDELEHANKEMELSKNRLQFALHEVSKLIEIATNNYNTKIRLTNPHLEKCYTVKNCTKTNCACYGREALRCWQIAGTYCGGKVQGAFAEKYGSCSQCEVFQKATSDPLYGIAEQFNNMMHMISLQYNELKNAHEELKSTRSMARREDSQAVQVPAPDP